MMTSQAVHTNVETSSKLGVGPLCQRQKKLQHAFARAGVDERHALAPDTLAEMIRHKSLALQTHTCK